MFKMDGNVMEMRRNKQTKKHCNQWNRGISKQVHVFLILGAPELNVVLQMRSHEDGVDSCQENLQHGSLWVAFPWEIVVYSSMDSSIGCREYLFCHEVSPPCIGISSIYHFLFSLPLCLVFSALLSWKAFPNMWGTRRWLGPSWFVFRKRRWCL